MPVPKTKPATSMPQASTPEPASHAMPEQEEFRQHVRRLTMSAVREMTRTSHVQGARVVDRSIRGRMHFQSSWVSQRAPPPLL